MTSAKSSLSFFVMPITNPDQLAEIKQLLDRGHSPLSAARCLTGVDYRDIEAQFGSIPHPPDRLSPALRGWWNQQSWVWRPDNRNPTTAPWERIVK
jgi:hypothetical protein